MWVQEVSNLEALAFIVGVVVFALALARIVPAADAPVPRLVWQEHEITSYDRALPKYFLASAAALTVGAVHAAVKNVPAVSAWLAAAGHGGHQVRDLSNSHLTIVVGGTVAITGLTWYALPRMLGRPLASRHLAGASFWFTVLGAGGFYLSHTVLGLILARMHHNGIDYHTGKHILGAWRSVPISLTATLMGIGYWTFVANVLATVWGARRIRTRLPERPLAAFLALGTLGLFVGTVQGVVQVLPAQEEWLHSAGAAGQYIDPIAHAHVNLVSGTLVLLAGLFFLEFRQPWSGGPAAALRTHTRVLWALVPGSWLFYGVFMWLGVTEGRLVRAGLSFEQAVDSLGRMHTVPLVIAGTLTLLGTWTLLAVVVTRGFRAGRAGAPAGTLAAAAATVLLVGTLQGLVQLFPAAKRWLESAGPYGDSIANAHAQLNMLGGVIVLVLALLLARADVLVGAPLPQSLSRTVLRTVVCGTVVYYLAAMLPAVVAGEQLRTGTIPGGTLVEVVGPLGMAAGAALSAWGFWRVTAAVWAVTADYRRQGRVRLHRELARYTAATPAWAGHVRGRYFVGAEAVGALAGFPGLGWLLSGRALVGLPLAFGGPAMAWGVIPLLVSPYGETPLSGRGVGPIVLWIAFTATLSVGGLSWVLTADGARGQGYALRRAATTSGLIVLLGAVASLPVLGLTVGGLTGPVKHSYTSAVPSENRGAYAVTKSGAMQLFTWRMEVPDFPADAPTIARSALRRFAVVQRAFDPPESYLLVSVDNGELVPWRRVRPRGTTLLLAPPPLDPGRYRLVIPSDSSFGGVTNHYFAVSRS